MSHPEDKSNWKLFLATLSVWLGTVSGSFALSPVVVDIKPFADGFVMAYADGTITWTDIDGIATDSVKLRMDLAGIEVREERVLAVSPECRILSVARDGNIRQLCRRQINNGADIVVGIACSKDNALILTEGGVILSTADFDTFTSMDFNGTYTSYYDETRFCAISASDNFFYIAGTFHNGMPAVFTSASGRIWSERTLSYTRERLTFCLEQQPLGLAYDSGLDRFVMACTDGYLFFMPGCSHCNTIERKSMRDINAVAFNGGRCLIIDN